MELEFGKEMPGHHFKEKIHHNFVVDLRVVMPKFGSEPRFEPEPLEPNFEFSSRFRVFAEPNLRSSSRFSQ